MKEHKPNHDPVNHPEHYTKHPSGVECIQITEHFNFNLGNVIKYVWRSNIKSKHPIEDLKKAKFYIEREISRLSQSKEYTASIRIPLFLNVSSEN